MGTTADKLELLLRTKERQKEYLQEKYPLLDFETIPFRAYLDLFQGRSYVPGFVGGWKAYGRYGRSNDEDADTRKYLYDYSGNGRDIELFNFGWTEDSGYNSTTYPGALVSDGVDDYGQCIKDFALPDDYTVVAVRKITNGNGTGFASKGNTSGAFIFDATSDKVGSNAWSYGKVTYASPMPALFSYQTKTSYNGKTITPGTAEDTEADPFYIFTHVKNGYSQAALYDVRIYDHTLTAEELQAVKDEMMADYEAATGGGIADVTYVADWDGKGRSNDEEETMRSQWIDKATGKVIDLHNYAYAEMSGWNGYSEDFNHITGPSPSDITDHILLYTVTSANNGWIWSRYSASSTYNTIASMRIKIIGVSSLSGTLRYYYIPDENPTTRFFIDINSDGIYTLPSSVKYTGEGSHNIGLYLMNLSEASIGKTMKVEQLPLYPGALVSDGVDDYGKMRGTLTDEVGTMLVYSVTPTTDTENKYVLRCSSGSDASMLVYYRNTNGNMYIGEPNKAVLGGIIEYLSREPGAPNAEFFIASGGFGGYGKSALSRLILIKEQLDECQIDFLEWKVSKEYRDWLKEKGYDYAIDEMLNN